MRPWQRIKGRFLKGAVTIFDAMLLAVVRVLVVGIRRRDPHGENVPADCFAAFAGVIDSIFIQDRDGGGGISNLLEFYSRGGRTDAPPQVVIPKL